MKPNLAILMFAITLTPQLLLSQEISVISDGFTGKELIKDLKKNGFTISNYTLPIINSCDFNQEAGNLYKLVIIKGNEIPLDTNKAAYQNIEKIRKFAESKGYTSPPIEVAPLLRKKISNEEMKKMGFNNLIIMHDPIKDTDGFRVLFIIDCDGYILHCFCYKTTPFSMAQREGVGFVFLDSSTYLK